MLINKILIQNSNNQLHKDFDRLGQLVYSKLFSVVIVLSICPCVHLSSKPEFINFPCQLTFLVNQPVGTFKTFRLVWEEIVLWKPCPVLVGCSLQNVSRLLLDSGGKHNLTEKRQSKLENEWNIIVKRYFIFQIVLFPLIKFTFTHRYFTFPFKPTLCIISWL